ncbi:MAG: hypothetical protein LBV17_01110 [Treponema sp.]|jgi:hypothetical protein|nr:hypothetical protein [Treponema sp.]
MKSKFYGMSLIVLIILAVFCLFFTGCDEFYDPYTKNNAPITVPIKYKITGNAYPVVIFYNNAIKTVETAYNVMLPWEESFFVKLEKDEDYKAFISVCSLNSYYLYWEQYSLTAEIFVNGVKRQSVNSFSHDVSANLTVTASETVNYNYTDYIY